MDYYKEAYKLWYDYLCRTEPKTWHPLIKKNFGNKIMDSEVWWGLYKDNFVEDQNRHEVVLIEHDTQCFEPEKNGFTVEVYARHPKHKIVKAFAKLVETHQKKYGIDTEIKENKTKKEYINYSDFPLYRPINKAVLKSLRTTLRVFDAYNQIHQENVDLKITKKPDLYDVWKRARTADSMSYTDVVEDKEGFNDSVNKATVRPHIVKYLKSADALIVNVHKGIFPCTNENVKPNIR